MTNAVCINCGQLKFGALTKCRCGFVPVTAIEYCISCQFTDRADPSAPESLSQIIAKSNAQKRWGPTFERALIPEPLAFYMSNTKDRKLLQLKRKARQGWFKREIDYYGTGPDGLSHQVWSSGKELERDVYAAAMNSDEKAIYGIEVYEEGKKQINFVTENLWFLAFDKCVISDRQIDGSGYYVQALNAWYGLLIDRFVEKGNLG